MVNQRLSADNIDPVNDLDNVLYEVTNEGGYKDWISGC
jgi:hypothetical protein